MEINTYPEMNAKIKYLLRLSDEPIQLYAAARIEELEQQVEELKRHMKELEEIR